MSLYLKHRPTRLSDVVGQDLEVRKLQGLLSQNKLPNVLLISGPTGTGKNTIARILAKELGVDPTDSNPNYIEQNCADCRGIDDVREIGSTMRLAPLKGKARVWVLDELVQWPKTTQQAALQMLENTPKHVYFFLCTSDLPSLLPTIKGRGFPVVLNSIAKPILEKLIWKVANAESKKLDSKVISVIADLAEGSARMALQHLEAVLQFDKKEDQLQSLEAVQNETVAIDLARGLMYNKKWPELSRIIASLTQDPETTRRIILKYCESVMLGDADIKTKARTDIIIAYFRDAWTDCGRAGLITSCWRISNK